MTSLLMLGIKYGMHPLVMEDAAEMQDATISAKVDTWDECENESWNGAADVVLRSALALLLTLLLLKGAPRSYCPP